MLLISKNLSRIRTITYLIENPQLIKLHLDGGMITNYRMLNKPWFHQIGINTVIDIGANVGQFAITIHKLLPQASLYSFEPLPDAFKQLEERMKNIKSFVAFNLGIGEEYGELEIENNGFSPASSFLKMTNINKLAFPFLSEIKTVKVKIETLDNIVKNIEISEQMLIKIDVQGFENKVLKGGKETVKKAALIIIETSFETLSEKQPLFDDIYHTLLKLGFKYIGMLEQVQDPRNGMNLYSDSIFIKNK